MLVIHGLAVLISAVFWVRAFTLYARDLWSLGGALPAPTQIVFDFHLPAVLCVGLVASFVAALSLRGLSIFIVSMTSVGVSVIGVSAMWWALRLPYQPL